ncbi:hypothetical protein HDV04_001215 [Boothiomyces sp. JEL0838]|nr:hypothetical protein HDV04_001215 [Boothiomyces sp. JEL0838]
MFWATWEKQEYVTCLKANYLFIYLRLQPVFYHLLCKKDICIEGKKLTGKFKTCISKQPGYRVEQVIDSNRRSFTKDPEDLIFDKDTLNPKKVAIHKLKADELCVKHKRIKLGIRDRKINLINLTVTLYAETDEGFVQIGEWTSNTISVRFGNCSEHADIHSIPARERERSYCAQLYKEILAFQKIPSADLKFLNDIPQLPSPVLRFTKSAFDEPQIRADFCGSPTDSLFSPVIGFPMQSPFAAFNRDLQTQYFSFCSTPNFTYQPYSLFQ